MIKKVFFLWLILIIAGSSKLKSESILELKDTTLQRGIVSEITIYGTFNQSNMNSLEIVLGFNALNLDIKTVSANDEYIMNCEKPVFNINSLDFENSTITITCNDIQNLNNGIICKLFVEALAGPDSITYITPKLLKINGIEQSEVSFIEGKIRIPGQPVTQQFPEGIGLNHPNPFTEKTEFPLSINYETNVLIKIFTNDGRFILSGDEANDMLKLSFLDNIGNEIPISSLKNKLKRGNYILKLTPDRMRFASGEYYLILITDDGVYHRNFIYLK